MVNQCFRLNVHHVFEFAFLHNRLSVLLLVFEGWTYFGGSEYIFQDTPVTFSNAREVCQAEGADLPVVTSKAENDFIFSLYPYANASWWLGASVSQNPFAVTWLDGSQGIAFENDTAYDGCDPAVDCLFLNDEPNNAGGNEFCLAQGDPTSTDNPSGWTDVSCQETRQIVCERNGELFSFAPSRAFATNQSIT